MAQFTVYENSNRVTKKAFPYLLDIQADLLDELQTTVVIPLSPDAMAGRLAMERLCPVVEMEGEKFVVLTSQLAGVDRSVLGRKVGDLSHYRSEIIAAVDFMISGI